MNKTKLLKAAMVKEEDLIKGLLRCHYYLGSLIENWIRESRKDAVNKVRQSAKKPMCRATRKRVKP